MLHRKTISFGDKGRLKSLAGEMKIPDSIRKEIERSGGFESLAQQVPAPGDLEVKSRVYHALSDPLRLTILHLLRYQPLCVCVISHFIRVGGSKLSYHLAILRENGLIESQYQGNWLIYSLTERGRRYLADDSGLRGEIPP